MSGTYRDKRAPRGVMAAFLVVALVCVALPSVGMLWARTDATTENRELAAAPALFAEDGSFNVGVLADAGAYFNDHFAYRNQLVAANAHLRATLGASATDQVVVGSDGWLYYGGTLNDYLGRSVLSDRALANIAHNLQLAQGYVKSQGAAFAFAVAPNKNTLYDENMPSFYVRAPGLSNTERLKPYLEAAGVNYVDLFGAFGGRDEVLYLKRDTHWDNRGALMAANDVLAAVGCAPVGVAEADGVVVDDFVGDLQGMLYPGEEVAEPNYYYAGIHEQAGDGASVTWSYVEGDDPTDGYIRTAGAGQGAGSLYLFRDSFGNALVPFFAAAFNQATFSKLVPYNMADAVQSGARAVIVERAERHVPDLATAPPIMANPMLRVSGAAPEGAHEAACAMEVTREGSYWVVRGTVDEQLEPESRLYVRVQSEQAAPVFYDPFWVSVAGASGEIESDNGLMAYIPAQSVDVSAAALSVYVK